MKTYPTSVSPNNFILGDDGIYVATILATTHDISSVYTEAVVQTAVSGANVILTSEEAFEGYVILI